MSQYCYRLESKLHLNSLKAYNHRRNKHKAKANQEAQTPGTPFSDPPGRMALMVSLTGLAFTDLTDESSGNPLKLQQAGFGTYFGST